MPKERVITGFGPTLLSVTSTGGTTRTGSWVPCGPFFGTQVTMSAVFSATSAGQSIYLEGVLTTTSTDVQRMVQRKSSQKTLTGRGTSTKGVSFVRLKSTALKANKSVTVYFNVVV